MGHKASETTLNINNEFGLGTANECTVQWLFKKFCKGDWEPWPTESHHQSWSSSTTWKVAEEIGFDHSMVNIHLKQIGKVKKLNKGVPHELTDIKKKMSLWSVVFPYSIQLSAMWETRVPSLGWEDSLEEGMATHSSLLAWRITMDRESWQVAVHGVAKSQTQLNN